jgi:hypothetical protein
MESWRVFTYRQEGEEGVRPGGSFAAEFMYQKVSGCRITYLVMAMVCVQTSPGLVMILSPGLSLEKYSIF